MSDEGGYLYISTEEAGRILGYSSRHIRELLKNGKLAGIRGVGGRWRIPESEVRRFSDPDVAAPPTGGAIGQLHAIHMEQSGHWQGLRNAAVSLGEQLWAPVQQLVGLRAWDERNEFLKCDWSDNSRVGLVIEEQELFRRLQEHLPDHRAWDLLEQWKGKVEFIHRNLQDLCQWVLEEPGISSLRQIPPGGSVHSNAGIFEWFAPTVVSNAVQDVCHGEPVDDIYRDLVEKEYVISAPSSGSLLSLTWAVVTHKYVIATSEDPDELEAQKRFHIELREDIREQPKFQDVVDGYRQLSRNAVELKKELQQISNLAIFPVRCKLCSG